jgi:O-antigen/teichoic acid export membrane protein
MMRTDFSVLSHKAKAFLKRPLAYNTLWMVFALGIRVLLQGIYFVIIAHALGAEQYGAFVSTAALVAIISPFASLGIGNLIVKNLSRNRELFEIYWGNSLFVILVFGLFWIALLVSVSRFFLPDALSMRIVLLIAVSDLLFAKIIDTAGRIFQSVQRLSGTGLINVTLTLFRFLAALIVVYTIPSLTAEDWAHYYLASTLLAAVFSVILVYRVFGTPKLDLPRLKLEAAEGLFFSISIAGQNVYNMIDKVMLAQLSTLAATGIYGAAQRMTEIVFLPIRAMLQAAYAKFFKHGETGVGGSLKVARRIIPLAFLYGAAAAIGVFLAAPLLTLLLGNEYEEAVNALRWMSAIPFLKSMHFIASDTLSGAGFQGIRSIFILITAVVNIFANIWLIPLFSWKGAVWASLLANTFLMVALWTVVTGHYMREASRSRNILFKS